MLTCFYRTDGQILSTTEAEKLAQIGVDQLIWLDLFNLTLNEREMIEQHLSVELFTRQEAEEIESSSKYAENEQEISANLSYIYRNGDRYAIDPVSFILRDNYLITQRNIPLRSFEDAKRMVRHNRKPALNGFNVFLVLFEARIDIEADFLEDLSKKIYAVGRNLAIDRELKEEMLLRIYQFQELTILFREATSELKRLFSFILRSEHFPRDEYEKIRVMIKDADSLLGHTGFNFERLEYLQNTFIGLLDMEQNKIIKIFTVVTVVFLPPTLIASMYGMNFHVMPELDWKFGYPLAVVMMIASSLLTLFVFRWKKWL